MFVTVNFAPAARKEALLVPSEAVIQTGKHTVVIVAQGDGKFAPVDVETGLESNGETEIRKGLEAGQKVVLSGQFLIDSEASLRGTLSRMGGTPQEEKPAAAAAATYKGSGKVEAIGKDEVTLSHEPMPALQWPAMTMGFKADPNVVPKDLKVGDAVSFELRRRADASYEIASITKTAK
jgi:membrane fusion protein, copper/silver efflux system